jgi:hypothetical protein
MTQHIPKRRAKPRRGPPGIPPEEFRCPAYLRWLRIEGVDSIELNKNLQLGMAEQAAMWSASRCVEPCHGPVNGTRSKGPDSGAIPMTREKHLEQHKIGWPAFEKKYGFSRPELAAYWWKRFKACQTSM